MKTVFVNPERCIGCKQCEIACAVEHSRSKSLLQAVFEAPTPHPRIHVVPGLYLHSSFPNKCRHCDPAPCQAVCPTGAIRRSDDQDTVLFDGNQCIACALCALVCPFDVIRFYRAATLARERAVALKCDHCLDRQQAGRAMACVEACKVGALEFGDINELTQSAGRRLAALVSAAASETGLETAALPANVQAWRDLGKATSQTGRGE